MIFLINNISAFSPILNETYLDELMTSLHQNGQRAISSIDIVGYSIFLEIKQTLVNLVQNVSWPRAECD